MGRRPTTRAFSDVEVEQAARELVTLRLTEDGRVPVDRHAAVRRRIACGMLEREVQRGRIAPEPVPRAIAAE
jgi:hypothetical protein